jgi:hypothetical protein
MCFASILLRITRVVFGSKLTRPIIVASGIVPRQNGHAKRFRTFGRLNVSRAFGSNRHLARALPFAFGAIEDENIVLIWIDPIAPATHFKKKNERGWIF